MYDNEALARRWFEEVWNKGRADAIDEMFAPDGIAHGLGNDERDLIGPAEFKEFFGKYTAAFRDIDITIEDVIREGDRTAVRFSVTAVHAGDDLGIPASGRTVRFAGMSFVRWKDGQIAEGWNLIDIQSMLQQIGAVPPAQVMA